MSVLVARDGEREKNAKNWLARGGDERTAGTKRNVISRIIIIIPFPLSLFFVFSVKLDEP